MADHVSRMTSGGLVGVFHEVHNDFFFVGFVDHITIINIGFLLKKCCSNVDVFLISKWRPTDEREPL